MSRTRWLPGAPVTPIVSLRRALTDKRLLGNSLQGDSWHLWRSLLLASMGEQLEPDELQSFQQVTGRTTPPTKRIEEALFCVGRRGGKDQAIATLASYLACCVNWRSVLTRGEKGLVAAIAPDQRQARIQRDRIEGVLDASPILSSMVTGKTADSIDLNNGISIEVRAASFRRLRGITAVAVIASEASFWHTDEASSNPDSEILNAVRPALATTGGPLIIISSPYARRGEVWSIYKQHFGAHGDPLILVAQGASRVFNPTLSQAFVDRALQRDHAAASAELLALFRSDIESFISRDSIEACVPPGVYERPPVAGITYTAAVDPAGGSGTDSMCLAIAHRDKDGVGVLDCIREARPIFSPSETVEAFKQTLASYGIGKAIGDHWGGMFVQEPFLPIRYELADKPKSDFYRDVLPLINSRKVELLDHPRLISQFANLERKTARSGRDSIDHMPGAHDDLANVAALALVLVAGQLTGGQRLAKYLDRLGRDPVIGGPTRPPAVVWNWGQLPSMSAVAYQNDPRRRGFHGW
jgi:hypothetical protein